ncbi:MAG: hypothetical protein IJV07_04810 [Alphaproteobacteria bacterium]|nr:hypothetical protein [Alphaproteobacteria bacterium]
MIPKLYIARTPDGNKFPLPSYTSKHHVGLNLCAAIGAPVKINPNERIYIPVGFAIGIPQGFCGQIVSHPQPAGTMGLIVSDAPHILNPADREPIFVLIHNISSNPHVLHRGDFIAQLIIMPVVQVCWQEIQSKAAGTITDETKLVVDEGQITAEPVQEKNKFESFRRPKSSIRNRFKNSGGDDAS